MSFSEELNELFNTWNLYDIFHIDSSASEEMINRSYRRLSLIYHPDKCKDKNQLEKNTKIFQALSKVHKILSCPTQRKYFDETGKIDDVSCENMFSGSFDNIEEWQAYWRALFPKITVEEIVRFESEYKNSDEERKDLIDAYLKYRGNMDLIMDTIMCATINDEERFREILIEEINHGNIRKFNRFINEPTFRKDKRRKKFLKEEKECKNYLKKDSNLLSSIIRSNQEKRERSFNSFLDNLMNKYGVDDTDNKDDVIIFHNSTSHNNITPVGKRSNNRKIKKRLSKH